MSREVSLKISLYLLLFPCVWVGMELGSPTVTGGDSLSFPSWLQVATICGLFWTLTGYLPGKESHLVLWSSVFGPHSLQSPCLPPTSPYVLHFFQPLHLPETQELLGMLPARSWSLKVSASRTSGPLTWTPFSAPAPHYVHSGLTMG